MTWKGCETLTPTAQPGLGRHGGALCAGGGPCPSGPGAAASLSQSLPRTSCQASPCLSFPPLPYNGLFALNCLIWGKSKVLSLGPRERGREGTPGVKTPRGWEEDPLPNRDRAALHDGGETGQNLSPSPQPFLRGTPATPPPPPTPRPPAPTPLPHRAREGLMARPTAITPLARVAQALSSPLPPMAAVLGARSSAPSTPPEEHGRGGGRPRSGVEEAQGEDADIGRQPG